MIVVTLRMVVRSGKRREFLQTLRGLLEPTRVEEGCLSYRLYQDVENKNAFTLVEEWETQEDLDSHIRTDNYKKLLVTMDLLREAPEMKFNTVSHTAGIEHVSEVLVKDSTTL